MFGGGWGGCNCGGGTITLFSHSLVTRRYINTYSSSGGGKWGRTMEGGLAGGGWEGWGGIGQWRVLRGGDDEGTHGRERIIA